MKIASFNINGVRGRLPLLLRWLQEAAPDVVCLQELKAPSGAFPVRELDAVGYSAVWVGQSAWNGVAILARGREPVLTRRGLPGAEADTQARYIEAAVNGVLIGCLYAPNGNPRPGPKFDYKLRWLARLEAHALSMRDLPAILVGDYNIIPTDLDVYKPERWQEDALFRPEVRASYARLLDQGWVDAIRTRHPEKRIYTFWDYLRNAYGRNAGLRLDHLLLSPTLGPRLKSAGVDAHVRAWERPSDHAPVWAELKLSRIKAT